MADIKGIELVSDIYGLEDETARDNAEINTSAIGNLATLNTTAKNNLVAAINEVNGALEQTTITFTGGSTVLKRKGNLLFIDCRLNTTDTEVYPVEVGENIPERFRPTQNLRLTIFNNNTDQPIGQFSYNATENKFLMYVFSSLAPQGAAELVATGITPLW